jgi:hypothetical protein
MIGIVVGHMWNSRQDDVEGKAHTRKKKPTFGESRKTRDKGVGDAENLDDLNVDGPKEVVSEPERDSGWREPEPKRNDNHNQPL